MRYLPCVVLAVLAPRLAAADDPNKAPNAPFAYAMTASELGVAGVLAGNFGEVWSSNGPGLALNFTPIVLGVGAGLGAHYGGLDARPALAVHGATWLGLEGFMLGALIDGREQAWQLRAGVLAWSLGAAGALAGGILGATTVDRDSETLPWLVGPAAGFVGGGLVVGGALVLIGGVDGDDAPGQFATGAALGLAAGIGLSTYLTMRGHEETSAVARLQSSISGATLSNDRATIVSVGGAF